MKQIHFLKLLFFLLFISFENSYTQDINLKIASSNKRDQIILNNIQYQNKHQDSITIRIEIDKISNELKNKGYFTNKIDSIIINKKYYKVYYSINQKVYQGRFYIDREDQYLFKDFKIKNDTIFIPTEKIQPTLLNITKKIDLEGKSFSKIQLKNILIKDNILYGDISIENSIKRFVNKVIVKGYDDFPKSFLKNHYQIKKKSVFNENKITSISEISKNLQFASEIKTPEVLFTKDSTFLYLYLKKRNNSSLDGLINFATKENGKLTLNGNIDLQLSNVLNTGEKLILFWNRIGDERQDFEIAVKTPYIFNSKITPEISFSIYKQDSTFINTKFDSKIYYNLNSKFKLALTYNSEFSNNLKTTQENNIDTFNNYFLGFQFDYIIPKNDIFFNDKLVLEINPSYGTRTINSKKNNQLKIETTASYIWNLNLRNNIYIKNTNGFLNSKTYLNNELYRIGGPKSIRGFNEQSIFAKQYVLFNIEYRFLTSEKSYLYTITDLGAIKTLDNHQNLSTIGLGFLFNTKNSLININTSVGKNENEKFNYNNAKLIVSWKTFF